METTNNFAPLYDPPFFLHKIHNYEKAVYERKGHWTEKEKIKYGVFLQIFRDKFEDRQTPILNKMFRVMSNFIKTRNHNQCRSHHQKMDRERFQIDSILDSIRSKYHPREYELFFQKYSRHIKAVNVQSVLNEKGFTPHKNVEKRKKIKLYSSQAKLTSLDPEPKDDEECQKVSKIENIEPISEVLNCGMDEQKYQQNIIQLEKQKQNGSENEISSKSKEEYVPELLPIKPSIVPEDLNYQKYEKNLKKTGLQYDSDSDDPNINCQKPKVAFFDIPMNFSASNPQQRLSPGQNMNMGMIPDFLNPMAQMSLPTHFQTPQFDPYRNFENQFPPVYRMNQNDFNYEENLVVDTKSLEEKKKWHLSEASRLCVEMNEHLQKANTCQQMMEMAEPRRGGYFYQNGYVNTQF